MVVLLLESHQTHVPFLWLYLAGFPLQSCQNDLNRSGWSRSALCARGAPKREIAAIPAMALASSTEEVSDSVTSAGVSLPSSAAKFQVPQILESVVMIRCRPASAPL